MGHHHDAPPARGRIPARPLQHALDRAPGGPALDPQAGQGDPAAAGAGAAAGFRILVLYSDTGGGHRAAASALSEALRVVEPDSEARLLDPLLGGRSRTIGELASLYSPLIRHAPPVWAALFHSSNTAAAFAALKAVFGPSLQRCLEAEVEAYRPDVVVSVHPLLNHVAAGALARAGPPPPLVTVVTDLARFHRGWRCREAELVVVPTAAAAADFQATGVDGARLRVLGLPVSLRFRPPARGERQALRRVYGLAEQAFTVLVSGGGEGSGKLENQVAALGAQEAPWQLIVVCGRNLRLRKRLLEMDLAVPSLLLGFVDNMADLMRAADLLVSKAGPGAIAEALATNLPVLVTSYLPGQESGNVDFVRQSGIGRYVPRASRLRRAVTELAAADGRIASEMAACAAEAARPYAALDIARECLGLARRYRASVQARR